MLKKLFYIITWQVKKIPKKTYAKKRFAKTTNLRNPYRYYLFEDLKQTYGVEKFNNKKILEIGPKDGEDSLRLESLKPKSITLIELPVVKNADHHLNKYYNEYLKPNLKKLKIEYNLIFANFHYMSNSEYNSLGKFDLIWCTGVLYHNPEQLRMLKKLYNLLETEGVLVLETSTTRNNSIQNEKVVEITTNGQYHFPTKKSLNQMLYMCGFDEIIESNCFNFENYNKKAIRVAVFAKKNKTDNKKVYRDQYLYGEST